jgi:hypothetical protein
MADLFFVLFVEMDPVRQWWDSPFAFAVVVVIGVVSIFAIALHGVPAKRKPAVIRELGKFLCFPELLRLLRKWSGRGNGPSAR